MRTRDNYLYQLIALLPGGACWPRAGLTARFAELLNVFAAELLQVETRTDALIDEFMPSTTSELIDRWENVMGLPDPCTGPLATLQERVNALVSKISIIGKASLSEQFYIDHAAALGYTITITILSANNWQVNAPLVTITYFVVGASSVGDPLQSSGNDLLECVINKIKPAHTIVTFNYT